MSSAGRAAVERDLFWKLLELREVVEPRAHVGAILELLVAATEADRGYLEIYASRDELHPRWTISHGCSVEEEAEIRATTSRGIVSTALANRQTLHVPFASLDERFAMQPSVKEQRLEAVICVPLGIVASGVLYLQGRRGHGPFDVDDVRLAEQVASHIWPSLEQLVRLDAIADDPTRAARKRMRLDAVVGRSAALARVFEQVEPYAPLDVTVLVTGPTGTGKSQIAQAIHINSQRGHGPFVDLNCAAIPENLLESELFGTMPGAFTGARRAPGKIEAAETGTLFLDEIAELPLPAQAKLLQLLQSRQYHPLGSNKVVTANIRLIAATNADLEAMIAERRFREDLYYRINVVSIRMPALAERADDIPVLVDSLLGRIAREHQLPEVRASDQFRQVLAMRDWPGNIRQLRSILEGALIRAAAESARQIEVRHLQDRQGQPETEPTFHEATRVFQREMLRRELNTQQWNVSAVAKRLDLTRSHIYNLIHQFKLSRGD